MSKSSRMLVRFKLREDSTVLIIYYHRNRTSSRRNATFEPSHTEDKEGQGEAQDCSLGISADCHDKM